ncbi:MULTISPECIES: DUF2231 domain-containing protein [Actinosynnema]|uniref:DUF2231 domain-containing protein n=1 Tax=Actinosynnema TaxID=40566 RepID=UPI0020A4E35D|nr:DUF2231 domain-containing protein [Actinosynnema pretiosum]MCP2092814.1 hypothetical protein [Actinosynnema pretiosum]
MEPTGELFTVFGLPAHPLVVHAVVVLLPLAALAAIAAALVPRWRQRYSAPLLGVTLLGVLAVPVAAKTGEQLEHRISQRFENPLITEHADMGDTLLPFALGFGVAVVLLLVAGRLADRERAASAEQAGGAGEPGSAGVPKTWRRVSVVVAVLVIATGAAATAQVVRIGHSGSTAVYDGVGN